MIKSHIVFGVADGWEQAGWRVLMHKWVDSELLEFLQK